VGSSVGNLVSCIKYWLFFTEIRVESDVEYQIKKRVRPWSGLVDPAPLPVRYTQQRGVHLQPRRTCTVLGIHPAMSGAATLARTLTLDAQVYPDAGCIQIRKRGLLTSSPSQEWFDLSAACPETPSAPPKLLLVLSCSFSDHSMLETSRAKRAATHAPQARPPDLPVQRPWCRKRSGALVVYRRQWARSSKRISYHHVAFFFMA
jgi:hypothetical protein